jgi:hypothetical protein
MDLYSVTTVMKEYDGYKNASFHWFYCDARTIPRPYADLIENYNGMNRLRAAYAEGYIDESFTLDEAQALKGYLDRTFGDKGMTTIKKRKLPITNNVVGWGALAEYYEVWKLDEVPGYPLPFKAQSCFDRGDSLADG